MLQYKQVAESLQLLVYLMLVKLSRIKLLWFLSLQIV